MAFKRRRRYAPKRRRRTFKRRRYSRRGRTFKKVYRKAKRSFRKKIRRTRKKRLVRTIERVITHDRPSSTYKHQGYVVLINPNNKKSYAQSDIYARDLNFGSPQDIRYIASALFNNGTVTPKGAQDTLTNQLSPTFLKVQVVRHRVKWCVRNCQRVPITLTWYKFIPTMSGTTVGTSTTTAGYTFDPKTMWTRAFADLLGVNQDNDVNTFPTFYTFPTNTVQPNDTDFVQGMMVEPGDVVNILKKWYRVKRKTYKLLPGQCKVLGTSDRFKDKEFQFERDCLLPDQTVYRNWKSGFTKLRSCFHVFTHVPEFAYQSGTSGSGDVGARPDASALNRGIFIGTPSTNPVTHPGAGKFLGPNANEDGIIIQYNQKVRMRAPLSGSSNSARDGIVYVHAYNTSYANNIQEVEDYAVMSGDRLNGV